MLHADPFRQFELWFADAAKAQPKLPESVALSTASREGRPSSRMVLLKGVSGGAFHFYTNYGSRKAHELDENPFASLLFYWPALDRQVRIEGRTTRSTREESDAYWATRPRESNLGAWASHQSEAIESREALLSALEAARARFEGVDPLPRPENWGGYVLKPDAFEFWVQGEFRLHDRFRYELRQGSWTNLRLSP